MAVVAVIIVVDYTNGLGFVDGPRGGSCAA